ncbi:hypothetical protein HanRHA438_Chr16g0749201 [Helianthus annuus]|nr:hypothetical protein HanIR_Chr16g0801061 [Helianthus annuus]KAJ0834923.1 hypothetical protein HanRHA438_Chr16g0749201 [Helianthus annuus]
MNRYTIKLDFFLSNTRRFLLSYITIIPENFFSRRLSLTANHNPARHIHRQRRCGFSDLRLPNLRWPALPSPMARNSLF